MNRLKNDLLLWFSLSLVIGIIAGFSLGWKSILLFIPIPALTFSFYFFKRKKILSIASKLIWPSACCVFGILGSSLILIREMKPANDISNYFGKEINLVAVSKTDMKQTEKGNRIWADAVSLKGDDLNQIELSGSLLIYLPKDAKSVKAHNQFNVTLKIKAPEGNFALRGSWAYRNDIHATGYATKVNVNGVDNSILGSLSLFRNRIESLFMINMPDENISRLAIAMLLGDAQNLDPEIIQSYSSSGASHIISISGLHVAIIFQFLLILFGFVFPSNLAPHFRYAAALFLLLIYALLTGACPPVMRAVLMISLVAIAKMLSLRIHMANLLGFSALVLLVWEPFLFFDVGFRLSFLAVLGLILAGNYFKNYSENLLPGLPSFIHQINGASFAAQLFTLPLIIWYFGQFPAYFLFANLLIIPIADLAIKTGFAAMIFCFVPLINQLLFKSLDLLLWLITWICKSIASLPGAVVHSPTFADAGFRTLLFFVLLGSLFILCRRKKMRASAEFELNA